ncbi:MAG: cation transporter [Armatimonadetes bacterium]|nr:cation transporter [Armatimonadota bacterium]
MPELEELDLTVRGMTCDSCAVHVAKALKSVPGVKSVDVPGWQSARAVVTADGGLSADALSAAVRKAGYAATLGARRPLEESQPHDGRRGGPFDLMAIGGSLGRVFTQDRGVAGKRGICPLTTAKHGCILHMPMGGMGI